LSALPAGTRITYSFGSFVTGAFGTVPGLLLLPYLTDTMAVPAAAAGLIVLVPKAWDVIFNPIAGRLSDASLAKRGSRLRFLLLGGIGIAIMFAALFAHPGFGVVGLDAAYVVVTFFLCATAYAFFQVPFNALPAELTDSPEERTKLTSWRIGFLALAILAGGGGAPAITNAIGGVAGYRVMGVAIGLLILGGTLVVFFGLRDAPVGALRPNTVGIRDLFATMREWKQFRWLLGVYFVQALGVGTVLAGISYLARYILGDAGYQTILFAAFVGPALLMMPVWPMIGRRWGKLFGFRASSVAFGIALLGVLGLALGPGLFGIVLSVGGYLSSADPDVALPQPDSAVNAILFGCTVIPAVLILLGIPLLRKSVLEVRV